MLEVWRGLETTWSSQALPHEEGGLSSDCRYPESCKSSRGAMGFPWTPTASLALSSDPNCLALSLPQPCFPPSVPETSGNVRLPGEVSQSRAWSPHRGFSDFCSLSSLGQALWERMGLPLDSGLCRALCTAGLWCCPIPELTALGVEKKLCSFLFCGVVSTQPRRHTLTEASVDSPNLSSPHHTPGREGFLSGLHCLTEGLWPQSSPALCPSTGECERY